MPHVASCATSSALKKKLTLTRSILARGDDQPCRSDTVPGASAIKSAKIDENNKISPMRFTSGFFLLRRNINRPVSMAPRSRNFSMP